MEEAPGHEQKLAAIAAKSAQHGFANGAAKLLDVTPSHEQKLAATAAESAQHGFANGATKLLDVTPGHEQKLAATAAKSAQHDFANGAAKLLEFYRRFFYAYIDSTDQKMSAATGRHPVASSHSGADSPALLKAVLADFCAASAERAKGDFLQFLRRRFWRQSEIHCGGNDPPGLGL